MQSPKKMSIPEIQELLAKKPRSPAAHLMMARALMQGGDQAKMLDHALKSVSFGKPRAAHYDTLMRALLKLKHNRMAEIVGRDAIARGLNDASIYFRLGVALARGKDVTGAVQCIDHAISLKPTNATYKSYRAKIAA